MSLPMLQVSEIKTLYYKVVTTGNVSQIVKPDYHKPLSIQWSVQTQNREFTMKSMKNMKRFGLRPNGEVSETSRLYGNFGQHGNV